MGDDVNRADVTVNLKDVYGQSITDEVELTFYNQQIHSLSQQYTVKFKGRPEVIPGVPAFPTGLAEVFVKPTKYRYKSIYINVAGGEQNLINEDFFVDPAKAKPTQMDFSDLPNKSYGSRLLEILLSSGIDQSEWNNLDKRIRATILNLSAKLSRALTKDKQPLITQVNNIDKTWLDKNHRERIFADAQKDLLTKLLKFPQAFEVVSGVLHHFPGTWKPANGDNSVKSRDAAGNVQLTFATDAAGNYLADIDLDDHRGIEHAADVLKHKMTGKDTDPYDIHEILLYFQQLDPEYRLI